MDTGSLMWAHTWLRAVHTKGGQEHTSLHESWLGGSCAMSIPFCFQSRKRQYLSYGIQTWHDGGLMHGIYAHARFDYLETLMQGHSGSAKAKIQCWITSTTKQATNSLLEQLAIFYMTLTLKTFIELDQLVSFKFNSLSCCWSFSWFCFTAVHWVCSFLGGGIGSEGIVGFGLE